MSKIESTGLVEAHGLEQVPLKDRNRGPLDMTMILGGIWVCVPVLTLSGLFVPALGPGLAILSAVIGSILGMLFPYIGSLIGAKFGIPGTSMTRASLGVKGSSIPSILTIVAAIGWYMAHILLAALFLNTISMKFIGFNALPLWCLLISIGCVIVTLLGIKTIVWLNRIFVPLLIIAIISAFYISMDTVNWVLPSYEATGTVSFSLAVSINFSVFVMSFIFGADYGRYANPNRRHVISFFGSITAVAIQVLFVIVGVYLFMATGKPDLIEQLIFLKLSFLAGFIALMATWTTNVTNLYAGGLALSNIFPKLKQFGSTMIIGVVGTISTLLVSSAMSYFSFLFTFLNIVGSGFVACNAIVIADYFMRKYTLNVPELFNYSPNSKYWYTNGFNPIAVITWIAGSLTCYFLPSNAFPLILGFFITIGIYVIFTKIANRESLQETHTQINEIG